MITDQEAFQRASDLASAERAAASRAFCEHDAAMRWYRLGENVETAVREADAARTPEAMQAYWDRVKRQDAKRAERLRQWRRLGCPLSFREWCQWKGFRDDDV